MQHKNPSFVDNEYGIYNEEYFREMICRERKRSERTNRPFILMLVELKDHLKAAGSSGITGKVVETVSATVRDTDILGWLQPAASIGVLITDIDNEAINSVIKNIQEKLDLKFHESLSAAHVRNISVSFQVFPENYEKFHHD